MDFKHQISDLKITTIIQTRTYLHWFNTEKGRDAHECYERIESGYIRYVNKNNPSMVIIQGDRFFKDLEEMYQSVLVNER